MFSRNVTGHFLWSSDPLQSTLRSHRWRSCSTFSSEPLIWMGESVWWHRTTHVLQLNSSWHGFPSLSFNIRKRNFGMSYLSRDRSGSETYLSLLSDWDLDLAFVSAAKPYLQLKMDIKPSEDSKYMCVSDSQDTDYLYRSLSFAFQASWLFSDCLIVKKKKNWGVFQSLDFCWRYPLMYMEI